MAIQNRHGTYPYFDKGKMVVGEIAVVTGGDPNTTDGKSVYMCFGNGNCQRFTTAEELQDAITRAIEQSGEFQDIVETTVTETLEDHPEWATTVQDGAITPAKLSSNFVTGLTENTAGNDTDLLIVGNQGTSTLRKFTLANLAAYGRKLQRNYTVGSGTIDLNNIPDGWHQIDATSQPSNMPITANSGIIFQASNTNGSGSKYQLYAYSQGTQLWQRVCWYGVWTSWKMVAGKQSMSVTVGNGNIMTLATNASTMDGHYMYVNCSVRFTGNRNSGELLIRLPNTVSATQYLTVCKSMVANVFYTNIAGGTGDIGCPTSFANGDIAYITGVISY